MRYEFIKSNQGQFDIKLLCQELEVSRSGYYAWLNREESNCTKHNRHLTRVIKEEFDKSRRTYGYRRIHQSLKTNGT